VRGFAGLLAYLVGVCAIISVGIAGLMALQSPIERKPTAATIAADSQTERLTKPVKQTSVARKKAHADQKHKVVVHVLRERIREAPTGAMSEIYGYAQEPRYIDPNPFRFFGR
jgi:hypothetical protein